MFTSKQGPDPCVCFRNQPGKKIPAAPGGHVTHVPQASVLVYKTGFFSAEPKHRFETGVLLASKKKIGGRII